MPSAKQKKITGWIPLSASASFLLRKKALLAWSALLVLITIVLTWLGFWLTTDLMDHFTGSFFTAAPSPEGLWGWIKYGSWYLGKWLFVLVSRTVAFFLAFLLAYSLTTPFYVFLSTSAEKIYSPTHFEADDALSLGTVLKDLLEGFKIGALGILVTIIALPVSFIPVLGQIAVFILYTFYLALMFIDYPASRRHWSLGRKLSWIRSNNAVAFRLGVIPAAVSMIPVLNMFLIAFLFPLLTVHATLNFTRIEQFGKTTVEPRHP